MTGLERRALLGDRQAQEECTRQGVVLPCPLCGNTNIRTSNWGMWRCWCPECRAKSDDCLRERDAIKQWNTRPAPPIGRCKDCEHYTLLGHCKIHSQEPDEYGPGAYVWCGIGIANVSEILEFVKYAPTIDPETLPIVRQLREELARVTAERDAIKKNPPVEIQADAFVLAVELAKVTAERDAAVRDLEQAITIYRDAEGWDILCRFCNGKSCLNDGECNPKWRGLRKEE